MDVADMSVLITGGTGTFGNAFVSRCIASRAFRKIVIMSRDEFKQHEMQARLTALLGREVVTSRFRFFLGDVRDRERLRTAFRGIDVVIHAAALKHVPFCEYNPSEALKTNVAGTQNVCDVAVESGVRQVVCLSTDKAVEPINFYGSTKMLAERYAVHSNVYSWDRTQVRCVRYGNIVGSRGSIVETARSLPVDVPFKITDARMTRFWMHIDRAAELVMWVIMNASSPTVPQGSIVIPRIKAASVLALLRTIDPTRELVSDGIRPGEKLHEQLLSRREHEHCYDAGDGYVTVIPEADEWSHVRESLRERLVSGMESYYSSDSERQMSAEELREVCQ